MEPCIHLDYSDNYSSCELVDLSGEFPECKPFVKHWKRTHMIGTDNPVNVQFCKLRGRVNSIFECYNPDEMSCHECK